MVLTDDRIIAKAVSTQHPELWNKHVEACEREQKSRVVAELEDWYKAEILNLATVIKGQHEGLFDNGWWEIFCVDCDKSSEPFRGSILDAAEKFFADGYAADSVERFTAICRACANVEPRISEEEEREDEAVYAYRKGEMG